MSTPAETPRWRFSHQDAVRKEHISAAPVISSQFPMVDNILFDDAFFFSREEVALLKARHVLFATKFRDEDSDRWYGGVVIASDIDAARAVAHGRGLGEEVLGELV